MGKPPCRHEKAQEQSDSSPGMPFNHWCHGNGLLDKFREQTFTLWSGARHRVTQSTSVQNQMIFLLTCHWKINSSLTLSHNAYVMHLASSHHVDILSSHQHKKKHEYCTIRTENDWKCFLLTCHREKPCLVSLSTWTPEQRSHNTHQWVLRGQVGMCDVNTRIHF